MEKSKCKRHVPEMMSEVFDAVHLMYEDNPSVEVDCYLYLSNLMQSDCFDIGLRAQEELVKMGRCPNCGVKMQTISYKEYHPEVNAYEVFYEQFCPNCDAGGRG